MTESRRKKGRGLLLAGHAVREATIAQIAAMAGEAKLDGREARVEEINAICAANLVTGRLLAQMTDRRRNKRRVMLLAGHAVKGATIAQIVPGSGAGSRVEGTGINTKNLHQKFLYISRQGEFQIPLICLERALLSGQDLAANTLQDLVAVPQIPLMSRICTLTLRIIPMMQTTKFQRDRCLRIVDDIHHLHCTLMAFGMNSENIQSPAMFEQIAQYTTSGSFSLLPAEPKIFHGRDSELENLVGTLLAESARIAILGPGGMGKTTLAITALHHTTVVSRYPTRHFVPCDSAHTRESLMEIIAVHLGLKASIGSLNKIIRYLIAGPPCLMILDNFETPWEQLDSQTMIEEFLSLLTDIPHVSLLVRSPCAVLDGLARLNGVNPFLLPLLPSSPTAQQTFIEITDEIHNDSVNQLLAITDNIPLEIQLIASPAAAEGHTETLERWELGKTSMLAPGYDKRSNLDFSIGLSLSSPRTQSLPQLLSPMSLLSDGISDLALIQSKLSITDVLKFVALEEFRWMGIHQSIAECLQTLGDIYLRRGEQSKAAKCWKDAKPLFERSLQTKAVEQIDRKLARMEESHQANLEKLSSITAPVAPTQQFDGPECIPNVGKVNEKAMVPSAI
ncbi:hypothetical protein C8R45DRAFT_1077395 [Mycena sanguinolenta]|nr:hypothetical protein C8R45DRAFT_1077395 [Mycena sanguinolenta]